VTVQIKARTGYATSTVALIQQAVADYINSLDIGQRVDQGRLYLPAQLYGQGPEFLTFEVNAVLLAEDPATPTNADVAPAFNELAITTVADITVEVTP